MGASDSLRTAIGALPTGWRACDLRDFATKVGSGATPHGGQAAYLKDRVSHALIRSQLVFDRQFERAGLVYLSYEQSHDLRGAEVLSGDVLLNITGDGTTFARACIVPDDVLPACVNQHVSIIRTNRKICDPSYLLSFLTHPLVKTYMESFSTGGSRRALTQGHIESFKIPLPPLPLQRRVAEILSAYDDLIENCLRRIRILEKMVRSLYREWFVHFRFPGHERHSLSPTPVGKIPEGWDVTDLAGVCVEGNGIQTGPFGSQLHESDYSEDGVPVVMPKNLIDFRIATDGITRIPESIADRLGRHRMQLGDIVYGRRGDIGRRAYLMLNQTGWFCGTGCLRIRPDADSVNGWYLFNYLGQENVVGLIAGRAQGVTMPNLNTGVMASVPIALPPRRVRMNTRVTHFQWQKSAKP